MLYIDIKYLRFISNRLPLFKQIRQNNWNCRCIICGDSSKNEYKARGYFYVHKGSLKYKCHNCGENSSFSYFLKNLDPNMWKDYRMEKFMDKKQEEPEEVWEKKVETKQFLIDSLMDRLDTLSQDHIAVKYCLERKIPYSKLKQLYFIDDIRKVVQLNEKYKESITTNEPRLFIPFFDDKGNLVAGTMRSFQKDASRRYITVKINEEAPNVFGHLDVDPSEPIYVVEGPLDSLFLDNAIAVSGTGFAYIETFIKNQNLIYVYDNQPHNKEVCKLLERLIDKGKKVVVWPNYIQEKDINDMVKNNIPVNEIIKKCTYSGLTAKLQFLRWKKSY